MAITNTETLRTIANANPGIFAALFARAPKTVTFKGKTYVRDAARSVDERLWYLAAAATTQPGSVGAISKGVYSLDEVYGLDPDRSQVDAAEQTLRAAKSKTSAVKSKLDGLRRMLRSFEQNLTNARAAQKEAQKVQVGDVFTAGISAAGRNLYADGQVKIWQDRIESLKTGALVGMAGQEGFQIPLNDGIAQNEAALAAAQGEQRAAEADLAEAKKTYDAEARKLRQEEEQARREQARDEAARRRADAEAKARDDAAARDTAAAEASASASASAAPMTNTQTDPGYVTDDPDYDYSDEGDFAGADEMTTARDLFANEDDARAYAEDVLGVLGIDSDDCDAVLDYLSPYSFDRYYADASCRCDGCARGGDCDVVDDTRLAMLDAGWGLDAFTGAQDYDGDPDAEGFDADDAEESFGADKITEEGEQGYIKPAPTPGQLFDFASLIPLIISAVMMLAPSILKALGAPISLEEANPPDSTLAQVPPSPKSRAATADDAQAGALTLGAVLLGVKLLG